VDNFGEFFDRFRRINVRSNEQLDELVAQARRVISGVQPQQLRDSTALPQQVATQMAAVQASLDGLMVDRPRRSIIRPPPHGDAVKELVISPTGEVTTLYTKVLELAALGALNIARASQVEPDAEGRWYIYIIDGPTLGPFARRSEALAAEVEWLVVNRLHQQPGDRN
jgi:hypothetical protein